MALFSKFNSKSQIFMSKSSSLLPALNTTYLNAPSSVYLNKRTFAEEAPGPAKCKIAIVTGGAKGIGLAIVKSLLKGGAKAVIIAATDVKAAEQASCHLNCEFGKNKVFFQPCDVTKREELEKVFKCTKAKFERVDIVVNNSGINKDACWEREIAINCNGVVHGTLLGFEAMGKCFGGNGGHVVNLSSIYGLMAAPACPIYCATKHFVLGFSRSLGSDFFFKKTGVKVMTLCPGVTDTALITDAPKYALKGFEGLGAELGKQLKSLPKQKPDDVACCFMKMLTEGENGSVYVSNNKECYMISIPPLSSMKAKPKCDTKKDDKKKEDDKKKDCDKKKEDDKKKDCDKKKEGDKKGGDKKEGDKKDCDKKEEKKKDCDKKEEKKKDDCDKKC